MKESKKIIDKEWFRGKKITIMGLGLNGGNLAACLFLGELDARLTVTDLRTAGELKPSMDRLTHLSINYVLGEHRLEDFQEADMIIKNPAVSLDSPYLEGVKRVETDLSLFLQFAPNPILAVTGSKGKSTVVTALHHILKKSIPGCRLGGNITLSPLSFINELNGDEPVILELSSWQLADLRDRRLLKPELSLITNIMHDHQNRYSSLEEYVKDKEEIFLSQNSDQTALFPLNDRGKKWAKKTKARVQFFSLHGPSERAIAWLEEQKGYIMQAGEKKELLPEELKVPGRHFRSNMLLAGTMAALYGIDPETIRERLECFGGVPHRMEKAGSSRGVTFYNDTAATIPDALMAALDSFDSPPLLICGGSDKELDLTPLNNLKGMAKGIFLLKGSATERMLPFIKKSECPWWGPYDTLEEAFAMALEKSETGDNIIMSPGATSFGMFLNEFDRGNRFRALVRERS